MLFVSPNEIRKGVGTLLIKYAVNTLKIKKVDVNEKNEQAAKFYQKMGFYVINRSERDNEGKPYPIITFGIKRTINHSKSKFRRNAKFWQIELLKN
jgi:GNAT superfamily N-acetyltransferase